MVTSGVHPALRARARLIRDGAVVWDGAIDSLKHLKDDVREVREGFECGILLHRLQRRARGRRDRGYETLFVERTEL